MGSCVLQFIRGGMCDSIVALSLLLMLLRKERTLQFGQV